MFFNPKAKKRFQHAGAVQPKLLAIQPNFYLPMCRKTFLAIQPNFKWLSSHISSGYPAKFQVAIQPMISQISSPNWQALRCQNSIENSIEFSIKKLRFFQEKNQSKATHLCLKKHIEKSSFNRHLKIDKKSIVHLKFFNRGCSG